MLDFSGPFEVLSTAARASKNPDFFRLYLIGESDATVTTRAGFKVIPDLRQQFPELDVRDNNTRWVDEGNLVSSGDISAGIDMSLLYLVSRLHSRDLAERTARQMEYDWQKLS